jgi:LacI family transcriptional regulator
MGAHYLLSIGRHRTYGFVPTVSRQYWSQARLDGFSSTLRENGIEPVVFRTDAPAGTKADLDGLQAWLKCLPKPAAVMAAWDTRATQVVEMANEAKIAIPSQLAVIGVDNDELLDESTVPPLTSIRPDHEKLGFVAARELERLMNGRSAKPYVAFLSRPKELVERESAIATAPAAYLLERANRFIAKNATKGISARDVADYLGVSRRLADLRFQQFNGETINETIIRHRLDAVKKMLATTNRPIKTVSIACGYTGLAYLKTLFKRRFGLTMRDYRAQHKS